MAELEGRASEVAVAALEKLKVWPREGGFGQTGPVCYPSYTVVRPLRRLRYPATTANMIWRFPASFAGHGRGARAAEDASRHRSEAGQSGSAMQKQPIRNYKITSALLFCHVVHYGWAVLLYDLFGCAI